METENALIKDVYLGLEDHNILTYNISLDYGGSGQGFGNYNCNENLSTHLKPLLAVFDVREFNKLKGLPCRVKRENGMVVAIGHIINNVWFEPRKLI